MGVGWYRPSPSFNEAQWFTWSFLICRSVRAARQADCRRWIAGRGTNQGIEEVAATYTCPPAGLQRGHGSAVRPGGADKGPPSPGCVHPVWNSPSEGGPRVGRVSRVLGHLRSPHGSLSAGQPCPKGG